MFSDVAFPMKSWQLIDSGAAKHDNSVGHPVAFAGTNVKFVPTGYEIIPATY